MEFLTVFIGLLAYLIGAIPTGYLIAKWNGIDDIRAHGSGNIGATNVSRFLGKHYFFLIFFLDAGKVYVFMHLIQPYFDYSHLCLFAILILFGNGYSIFLRGSGGKGVATLCGLVTAIYPKATLPLLGVWALLLCITKIIGIASVGAALCFPFYAYTTHNKTFFLFSLFAATLIIWKHKPNIQAYLE
ncbi:MAG TPA: glycerol-3-phosphate acyltransferase [Candidatus Babeliales bacterium]|jgi:glycerol-3-phosphate acyltransferase PlsY|nr:glycerol-3-phosphate acyltransferase [Candidatus Babeliales bacterium]